MCMLIFIILQEVFFVFVEIFIFDCFMLYIEFGCIVVLLGFFGCGKSMLLCLLVGLSVLVSGEICFGDRLVVCVGWGLFLEQCDIGMVFQDYVFWLYMSVVQNVVFLLCMCGVFCSECECWVSEVLVWVGFNGFVECKFLGFFGGQQQWVVLVWVIVVVLWVLLFDELFFNLDSELCELLCGEMSCLL